MGCGTSQLLDDVQFKASLVPLLLLAANYFAPLFAAGVGAGPGRFRTVVQQPKTIQDRIGVIEPRWQEFAPGELDGIGREVLLGFFKRCPDAVELFHFTTGQPIDSLDTNPSFRIHATLLTRTVSQAIAAIHDNRLDECAREMQDIGRRHGPLGAKPHQIRHMGDSLMEVLRSRLGDRWTPDVEAAWRELFSLMSKNIRAGLKGALPKPPPPTLQAAAAMAKETWELLKVDLEGNGARVYFGMFESSPAIKVMFPFTHDEQFRRLGLADQRLRNHAATVMIAVGSVINGMNEDLKATKNTLKSLGASHGHIGVKPDMMDHLGASLINVMSELVGDEKWTPELEAAWEKVYGEVASSFNSGIELWRKGGAPNAAVAGCKPALGTTTIW